MPSYFSAKLAMRMGAGPFLASVHDWGFGARTDLPLPGERRGFLRGTALAVGVIPIWIVAWLPLQDLGAHLELMDAAEERLRGLGCPKINLQVRRSNAAVIAFYRAMGFTEDAVVSLGKRLR